MIQIYFLAVALNLGCGLALLLPERPHPRQLLRHLDFVLSDKKVRAFLGAFGMVAGVLTFLSPVQGDVPFVGDIVPALSSFFAGLVLLFELQPPRPGLPPSGSGSPEPAEGAVAAPEAGDGRFRALLLGSGRLIGFLALLAGIAHFFFPLELFL